MTSATAKRYADSLSAVESSDATAIESSLAAIVSAFRAFPEIGVFYESPRFSSTTKKEVFRKVLTGKTDPLVLNLVLLLIDRNRTMELPGIYKEYVRNNDAKLGRVTATVTLARDFSGDSALLDAIRNTILSHAADFGIATANPEVSLQVRTRPGILGGTIIKVEDYLLDASVSTYLRSWASRVKQRTRNMGA